MTLVEYENGYLSYIIAVILVILFGLFLSIIIIPIALVLTKNLVHKCSVCWNRLGSDGKIFHSMKWQDTIISLKFGEVGFILTKKIVLAIVLGVLLFLIIVYKINNLSYYDFDEPMRPTHSTWD